MARGIVRRGHTNMTTVVRVAPDQVNIEVVVAEAVAEAVDAIFEDRLRGVVRLLRPQAVVTSHVGVTRAFLYDAWHWHAPTLGLVLRRASLRG